MNHHPKPYGSPPCWGNKFQDGDKECGQCRFQDTCRPAMLERTINSPDQRTSLPVLRNYVPNMPPPPPPPPTPNYQTAMVPMPTRPYAPPVSNLPVARTVPFPNSPSAAPAPQQQPQQQVQQYYQQSTGWSLPNPTSPNPLAPMFRPGAPSPSYYLTHYPGESVALRVIKNLLLRAAEAIFGELMQFFRHWTWPALV